MGTDVRFPRLVAETLSGNSLILPDAFDEQIALVVLAFRRHAQSVVDSWISPVTRRFGDVPGFAWYEVPMLAGGWRLMSGFIDGGMRAGIAPAHHDRVATFYGDTTRVCEALGILDLDSAYLFLIDDEGRLLWRGSGWASARRQQELFAAIDHNIVRHDHKDAGKPLDL